MTKEVIIITLIALVIYLYYQQNNQASLAIQPNNQQIQDLKAELNHYQTLYQKRVEKDLATDQSEKIKELSEIYQQKLSELETKYSQQFQDLADGLREEKISWAQDRSILQELSKFHQLVATNKTSSLARTKIDQAEALVEQINQPEIKQLANWMVTDSSFILAHNNLLNRLSEQEDEFEENRNQIKILIQKNQDLTEELEAKKELYQDEVNNSLGLSKKLEQKNKQIENLEKKLAKKK